MFTEKIFKQSNNATDFFKGYGSFGEIKGTVEKGTNSVFGKTDDYLIECIYEKDEYGVFSRKDTFTNKSGKELNVKCLKSRFVFDGGEYDVYSQFNNWQTESIGGWQPLVTGVCATGASLRTTTSATPFMVLWNNQTQRGVAFHLLPKSAWEIKITRTAKILKHSSVVVELGILDYNFDITLKDGEKIEMPEIICYEIRNKLHMDCYKLHNYMHTKYPRREMPILYDTWMYKFDHIDYTSVASQIELAANLGVEYFFIDAGWFGNGDAWSSIVGDWTENTKTRLAGRMLDIANKVRENGMKFGLWLEPERAAATSNSVKEHREYYMESDIDPSKYFLDFANPAAREWMLGVIDRLIEHYGVEYIKNDFNDDMYFDPYGSAYLKYHEGHQQFIDELRKRHPNLYLSSCASGGHRMELANYIKFDSSWPSDNENPYCEMRMYRDTILRLPPQAMERWVAAHSLIGMESLYEPFKDCNDYNVERMVACGDAMWHNIVGVQQSFLEGYMTAGPVGFSCDLSKLSPKATEALKTFVANMKKDRSFWMKAVARILCDTKSVTTYQYSDMAITKVIIQMFVHEAMQQNFVVIPELDETKKYSVKNEIRTGKELMDEGILIDTPEFNDSWHHMYQIEISEVE